MAAGTSDPTKGQQHIPRLDVLVNNVGGYRNSRHVTADGLERTFALNHLASFLLTDLLLDRLRDSAPARVVTISSSARTGSAPPAHADGAAAPPVPCTPKFTRRKAAVRVARKGRPACPGSALPSRCSSTARPQSLPNAPPTTDPPPDQRST